MVFEEWEIFETKTLDCFYFLSFIHTSLLSHKEHWGRLGSGASEKELGFEWEKKNLRMRGLDFVALLFKWRQKRPQSEGQSQKQLVIM